MHSVHAHSVTQADDGSKDDVAAASGSSSLSTTINHYQPIPLIPKAIAHSWAQGLICITVCNTCCNQTLSLDSQIRDLWTYDEIPKRYN